MEAEFRRIPGVLATAVGYTGGTTQNPSYQDVCRGDTGHAEAVRVEFDPSKVTYEQLLHVFWSQHDPTTPNQQGPNRGSQYRSAVFVHSDEQEAEAREALASLEAQKKFRGPIVTQISRAKPFYRAEEYHQQYEEKSGFAGCRLF